MVFMYLYNRALDEIEGKILVLIVLSVDSVTSPKLKLEDVNVSK